MFDKIFSIKNDNEYTTLTIFGIRFKKFLTKVYLNNIDNKLVQMEKRLNSIVEMNNRNLTFYPLEDLLEKDFYKQFAQNDLSQKYIQLKRGLDEKSICLLDKILYRILQYGKYGQTEFTVDEEEYQNILKVVNHLKTPLVLSDDYISINGFCLPKDFIFCSTAVVFRHFIDSIKDKNKILNGDIIDAGAYIGDSALVLSDYTNGKIHAFEPEESNFKNLEKTIAINNLSNKIVPIKLGLGKENAICTLNVDKDDIIGASFCNDNIKKNIKQEVGITSIDKYVEDNNIQRVGLIKTDVEGFEQDLLKGAINTIKRDKPVLMISIYHTFNDFWGIKPLIESWNLGYKFSLKKPTTLDYVGDLVLNAEVSANTEENK